MRNLYLFYGGIVFSLLTSFTDLNAQELAYLNGKLTWLRSEKVNQLNTQGLKSGTWWWQQGDSLIIIAEYESGKLNGYFRAFEPKELFLLYSIEFRDGMVNGNYIRYSPSGQIDEIKPYINNKIHGIAQTFYLNNRLWHEEAYIQGIKHGISKDYYENGKLEQYATYYNGKLKGEFKTFYKNGNIESRGDAENLSNIMFYDKKGRLRKKRVYNSQGQYQHSIIYNRKGDEIRKKKEFLPSGS